MTVEDTAGVTELLLAGGRAEVIQLPREQGFVWEATGADGTSGQAEEPVGSQLEAFAGAEAFLIQHADDAYVHDAAHAGCFQPHLSADGYVDCDGRPL
jgi:hypothetical protein